MNGWWQDIRYGLRVLAKNPGFTAAAVLTLALGIGATTAMFSVVYGMLLRPLPYSDPEQIVRLWEVNERGGRMSFADPNFTDVRSQNRSLQGLAEYRTNLQSVSGGSEPTRTLTASVSHDFFSIMRVRPFSGRNFGDEDQRPGAAPVALVSYEYWRQYLGETTQLSALRLKIGARSFSVIGVLPAHFRFPEGADVWIPRELSPVLPSRTAHNWSVVGRLRDGFTLGASRSELSAIAERIKHQYGPDISMTTVAVEPVQEAMTAHVRPALILLLGASAFLLVIACVNVVNLMLAQAATRQRELAIRAALGAARGRLARQFFTEALLLAVLACALGALAADWGVKALLAIAPKTLPRLEDVSVNFPVLAFSGAITLLLATGLAIASALRAGSGNPHDTLSDGNQRYAGSMRGQKLGHLLIAGQLATVLTLLAAAGLLGRSLVRVLSVDPGFRIQRVVTMDLALPGAFENSQKPSRIQFLNDLITRLRSVPGVEDVGGTNSLPLAAGFPADGSYIVMNPGQISRHGQDLIKRSAEGSLYSDPALLGEVTVFFEQLVRNPTLTGQADYVVASEGYFMTLGIPLLRGRLFDDRDQIDAPHVALISASLAQEKWPDRDPLGRVIEFGNMDGDLRLLTVVGVVGDVREKSLEVSARPTVYVNYRQRPQATYRFTIVLRTGGDLTSVTSAAREILRDLDPSVPPRFSTLPQVFSASFETRRFSLILVGAFSVMALLLAVAGIYGVTSYAVTRRTREIGVRMALGASAKQVLVMIVGQGALTIAIGLTLGLTSAFLAARAMAYLLFGVTPTDPLTFSGAAVLLAVVALIACYIPARRATKVDPMVALRYE